MRISVRKTPEASAAAPLFKSKPLKKETALHHYSIAECIRYSLGVVFSHFLKVEQKLLSLLKPQAKAISLIDIPGVFRRNFAEFSRVAIRY